MDIRLNDEQTMIRDTVATSLASDRARVAEIDPQRRIPVDVGRPVPQHDLFALPFPPEYGGLSGSA